ncbi:MAG: glycosyltransferase, partial [Bacteroidaceae bacterium]|nr:glycosyltransferase [Bacteroidaceae bacterium]
MLSISFVVPIYNVEDYLQECLDSVISEAAKFDDSEIILVNDGSTDSSGKIAEQCSKAYPNLVKLINQENAGLSAARNAGLAQSTKDYVCFVDSDDRLEDNFADVVNSRLKGLDVDVFVFGANWNKTAYGCCIDSDVLPGPQAWTLLREKKCYSTCVPLQIFNRSFLAENSLSFEDGIIYE